MAWLIACPYHYLGIFGLIFFFVVFFFQINIFGHTEHNTDKKLKSIGIFNLFIVGKNSYNLQ
jgi:hypothetical protein